jgi:hypothetical protein
MAFNGRKIDKSEENSGKCLNEYEKEGKRINEYVFIVNQKQNEGNNRKINSSLICAEAFNESHKFRLGCGTKNRKIGGKKKRSSLFFHYVP